MSHTRTNRPAALRRTGAVATVGLLLAGLLSGCGPTVTAPDVVGMRLDDAHRAFEKLEVGDFNDVDVVGDDRFVFLDHNWVVVKQSPAPGTKDVDTGTTIKLSVGKISDDDIAEQIPADSPVAVELAEDAAEEKARQQKEADEKAADHTKEAAEEAKKAKEEAAERADAAQEYTATIDPYARSFKGVMRLYRINADHVRAAGGGPEVAASNALAAQDYFNTGSTRVVTAIPPDNLGLSGVNTDMGLAMAGMNQACDALLDAIDTGAPSAFAREKRLRNQAVRQWSDTMRRIYGATDRKPILPAS